MRSKSIFARLYKLVRSSRLEFPSSIKRTSSSAGRFLPRRTNKKLPKVKKHLPKKPRRRPSRGSELESASRFPKCSSTSRTQLVTRSPSHVSSCSLFLPNPKLSPERSQTRRSSARERGEERIDLEALTSHPNLKRLRTTRRRRILEITRGDPGGTIRLKMSEMTTGLIPTTEGDTHLMMTIVMYTGLLQKVQEADTILLTTMTIIDSTEEVPTLRRTSTLTSRSQDQVAMAE